MGPPKRRRSGDELRAAFLYGIVYPPLAETTGPVRSTSVASLGRVDGLYRII
jgi:hypothetical protein